MATKRNAPSEKVYGEPQTPKAPGGIRIEYNDVEGLHHVQVYVDKAWFTVGRECEEHDAEVIARRLEAWRKGK